MPAGVIGSWNRFDAKTCYRSITANDIAESRRRSGSTSKAANPVSTPTRGDIPNCGSFHWIADDQPRILGVVR